jgi:hypothetical protein
MVKRRTLARTVTLAASAALLLTACGGDDTSDANDRIAGAETGGGKPSAPASTEESVQRPEIKLPNDLTDTFEG